MYLVQLLGGEATTLKSAVYRHLIEPLVRDQVNRSYNMHCLKASKYFC